MIVFAVGFWIGALFGVCAYIGYDEYFAPWLDDLRETRVKRGPRLPGSR